MSDVSIGAGGPETDPVPYVEGPPIGKMSAIKIEPQGDLPAFKDPTAGATEQTPGPPAPTPQAPTIVDDLNPVGSADAAEPSVFDSPVVKAMVTARANGKTWGQIQDTLQTNTQALLKQGVPQDQIDQTMGFKSGDLAGVETLIDAHAAKAAESGPPPAPDDQQGWFNHIVRSFAGGVQQTGVGEASGAAADAAGYPMPDLTPADQGWADRVATMLGVQSGSIMAMASGAAVGAAAGSELPIVGNAVGAVVGGLIGYWLDDNFRRTVTDIRTQGNVPVEDIATQMAVRAWESTKSTATVGAAMAVGGPAAGLAAKAGLGAVGSKVVAGTAELMAMAGAAKVFGQNMGTGQDWLDQAVMLALLHTTGVPAKAKEITMSTVKSAYKALADNYANTGEAPADAVARAQMVYHGTNKSFAEFDASKLQSSSGSYDAGQGFYFTDDKEIAAFFADNAKTGRVIAAHLDMQNPLTVDLNTHPEGTDFNKTSIIKQAWADGHDAVIFKNSSEGKGPVTTTFVVKDPAQIKQIAPPKIDPINPPEAPRTIPDIKKIIPPKPEEASPSLEDDLHGLTTRGEADRIQMMQYLAALPDTVGQPPAEGGYQSFDEKAYNHIERPDAVPFDSAEQKLYDQTIQPLRDVHAELYQRAKGILNGVEQAQLDPNYVPRLAQGKNFEQDRLAGGQEAIPFMGGQGKLSQTTGALRTPTFHTIVGQDGNRVVGSEGKRGGLIVYHDGEAKSVNGQITDPKAEDPEARADLRAGMQFTDDTGAEWRITRSNTKEIEDNTSTKYHKSAVGNLADSILKLNRVIRNKELADKVTSSPEWLDHATKAGGNQGAEALAAGWKEVHIPGYEGWLIDPEIREKLEDFVSGGPQLMGDRTWAINKIAVGALFSTPFGLLAHGKNLVGMAAIGRGFDNANVARGWRTGMKAINDVYNLSPDYVATLKAKGSLISSGIGKGSMTEFLMNKFGQDIPKDPARFGPIVKALGLNGPADLASNYMKWMSKELFQVGDVLYMQRVNELMEKGLSREDAINETEKYLPTYRSYSRALGSRFISKALYGSNTTSFGRFDAGKIKAIANMATSLKEGLQDQNPVAVKDALGRFVVMGLMVTMVAPIINAVVQKATGNPNATFGLGGTAKMAQDAVDFAKDPSFDKFGSLVAKQWVPAIGTKAVVEQAFNTDTFRKQPISEGDTGQQIVEKGEYAGQGLVSPEAGAAKDFGKFFRQGLGISDNTPYNPSKQQLREIQKRWPKDTSLIQKIEAWFH